MRVGREKLAESRNRILEAAAMQTAYHVLKSIPGFFRPTSFPSDRRGAGRAKACFSDSRGADPGGLA
jgi:hypothetical protein